MQNLLPRQAYLDEPLDYYVFTKVYRCVRPLWSPNFTEGEARTEEMPDRPYKVSNGCKAAQYVFLRKLHFL